MYLIHSCKDKEQGWYSYLKIIKSTFPQEFNSLEEIRTESLVYLLQSLVLCRGRESKKYSGIWGAGEELFQKIRLPLSNPL